MRKTPTSTVYIPLFLIQMIANHVFIYILECNECGFTYFILLQTYSNGGDGEVKCHDCIDESCYVGHSMKQHTQKKYLTLMDLGETWFLHSAS